MSVAVPTNVRAINGNPGKRALQPAGEPDPEYLQDFTPPHWLTPGGVEAWNIMAPAHAKAKLLCVVDVPLFCMYCEAVHRYFAENRELCEIRGRGEFPIWEGKNGGFSYSPLVVLAKRAGETIERCANHFGGSPMARTKIKVQQQEDMFASDFESFVRALHEQRQVA